MSRLTLPSLRGRPYRRARRYAGNLDTAYFGKPITPQQLHRLVPDPTLNTPQHHGWAWVARWTVEIVLALAAGIVLARVIAP